jgi:hypothetical protein
MTTMDFMNDYYFLEEATRFTKEIKENPKIRSSNRLNMRFVKLRKEALNRNVKLYFLNNGLTKRKRNQSMFKAQEQAIYWHCEIIFPNASHLTISKKFCENLKLCDILQSLLDNDRALEFYKSEGIGKLRVMLKAEGLKNNKNRFYELNLKRSLKANLRGKVVIEFPTLHVVMSHSADEFDVIESDDETIESELRNFKKTLHEEVFSRKVGENPQLILSPEEVPIIAQVLDESPNRQKTENHSQSPYKQDKRTENHSQVGNSDEEIKPTNYFFSNDST